MRFLEEWPLLLENVKFLYGSDTSILILSHESRYQAVVSRYDKLAQSWTKFLHSKPAIYRENAIHYLLQETENRIVKILEENGAAVPFLGDQGVEEICLQGRPKEGSKENANESCASSNHIEPEFANTPKEIVPTNEEIVVETPKKDKKKGKKISEIAKAFEPSTTKDEVNMWGTLGSSGRGKKKCIKDKKTDPEQVIKVIQKPDDDWMNWDKKKIEEKDKKKEGSEGLVEVRAEEPMPVPCELSEETPPPTDRHFVDRNEEEAPCEPTVYRYDSVGEDAAHALDEKPVTTLEYYSEGFKEEEPIFKLNTSKYSGEIAEEIRVKSPCEPCEEIVPDLYSSWSFVKNSKKHKVKAAVEKFSEPEQEPETVVLASEPDVGACGSLSKKGLLEQLGEEVRLPLESEPAPLQSKFEENSEPVHIPLKTKKMKKGKSRMKSWVVVEPLEAEPMPSVSEFEVPINVSEKKKKKGKKAKKVFAEDSPLEDSAIVVPQFKFPEPASEYSLLSEESAVEILSAPATQPQEPKEPIFTIPSHTPTPSPEPTTRTIQSETKKGQTIVLKTLFSGKTRTEALGTIVTLPENTRESIFSVANSYLDRKIGPSPRTLRMKYGAGKDGDLDVATLEEELWPEYLEYFRLCTRFPELTVEVVEG